MQIVSDCNSERMTRIDLHFTNLFQQ